MYFDKACTESLVQAFVTVEAGRNGAINDPDRLMNV